MAKRLKVDESGDNEELQALFDTIADQAGKPKLEVVNKKAEAAAPAALVAETASADDAADTPELQELFDSVAAQAGKPAPAVSAPVVTAATVPSPASDDSGDSAELQQLFDSVAAGAAPSETISAPTEHVPQTAEERQASVFNKIGHLTRQLHDTLCELGYDRMLEATAQELPDARQRLNYISQMTEQAASRVLNATDVAKPIQDRVEQSARALSARWDQLYNKQLSVEDFKALAGETRVFMSQVSQDSKVVNEQLLEIMMAQDFQDLTGQVIKRIVDMAQRLESELLGVLIQVMPDAKRTPETQGLLNGPVVSAAGRDDVVTNQEQVDDLLESLGF